MKIIELLHEAIHLQGLGMKVTDLPLIINTEAITYTFAQIITETDKYLLIVIPDSETGAEYCKIINKTKIDSVDIIYEQMISENEEEGTQKLKEVI